MYKRQVLECTAREFVNRVQNMRKEAGLAVADRIRVWVRGDDALERAVRRHLGYIAGETLALEVQTGGMPDKALLEQQWDINNLDGTIGITRA